MKVSEVLTGYEAGMNILDSVKIKKYLTFAEKHSLLEQVKHNGVEIKDGVAVYDAMTGDFLFGVAVIKFYTDLTFGEDSLDEMDRMRNSGLYNFLTEQFYRDYRELRGYYKDRVDALLAVENDTRNLLNRQLTDLSEKAMQTLDAIAKKADRLDRKALNRLTRGLNRLIAGTEADGAEVE